MPTASAKLQPGSVAKAGTGELAPGGPQQAEPWLVEFVGESGSGKSLLAAKLTEYLRTAGGDSCSVLGPADLGPDCQGSRGAKARNRLADMRRLAGLARDAHFRSLLWQRFGFRRLRHKARIGYILGMFIKYCRITERLRRQPRRTLVVLDEGFMTSAGYMFNPDPTLTPDRQERILDAIARVKGPGYARFRKLYVIVRSGDFDVLWNRVRARHQESVYARLSREEAQAFHEKAAGALAAIVEFLRRTNQAYVVIENAPGNGDDLEAFRRIQAILAAGCACSAGIPAPADVHK